MVSNDGLVDLVTHGEETHPSTRPVTRTRSRPPVPHHPSSFPDPSDRRLVLRLQTFVTESVYDVDGPGDRGGRFYSYRPPGVGLQESHLL